MTRKESIARQLFDVGAVCLDTKDGFALKLHETNPHAARSPIKFNIRPPGTKGGRVPETLFRELGAELVRLIMETDSSIRVLAGVPHAGDILVDEMCVYARVNLGVPDFARVKLAKSEGSAQRRVTGLIDFVGTFPGGDDNKLALVDDLITKADSKIESLDVLRAATFQTQYCFVLIDRGQGGAEQLAKFGVTLKSLYTMEWLIDFYREENLVTDEEHSAITEYMQMA
jgi:orotate phosphoribosyltransferase